MKQFLLSFLAEVDRLAKTKYLAMYKGSATDLLIVRVGIVAAAHRLGLLVIDEFQVLLGAKGDNREKLLNFLVTFSNTVSVPVLHIGTLAAELMLPEDLRGIRRIGDNGTIKWKNLKQGSDWDLIIDGLFEFQWTRIPVNIDIDRFPDEREQLSNALYDETEGILGLAIPLFQLTQRHAIVTGTERITPALIEKVAKENFGALRKSLNAIREGSPSPAFERQATGRSATK